MSYIPHPGNAHDPDVRVRIRWGCGHITNAWFSRGASAEDIKTEEACYACSRTNPFLVDGSTKCGHTSEKGHGTGQ